MSSENGRLNATAAAVNIANILSARFVNVRQAGLVLLINNAYNEVNNGNVGSEPTEIRLSLNGELFIGGKKVDPNNPMPGYKVFMDTKKSRSK